MLNSPGSAAFALHRVPRGLQRLGQKLAGWLPSLKWRLTLGSVLALSLAIALITTALLRRAEADLLAAQRQSELSEAARSAAVLSRRLIELQRVLAGVGTRLDAEILADEKKLLDFMDARSALLALYYSIVVAAPDGTTLARLDGQGARKPTQSVGDRSFFTRTLREERPIVSEPLISRFTGEPIIVLTYPLKGAAGVNGIGGMLLGTLPLGNRDLLADMVDQHHVESQTLLVVSDAQGRILAHPDKSRLLKNLSDEPRLSAAYAAWVAAGGIVEPTGLSLHQPGDLITAAGVPGPDWLVWRVLPQAELLAPLQAARHHAWLWAAGVLPLLSVLALLLIGVALKPLAQLQRRASSLFDGSQAEADWPVARGEIGSLSAVLKQVSIERQQMEALNNQALRRLESVMAAAPVGIAFTRGHRLELVSDDMCRMFGKTEAELLSQPAQVLHATQEQYRELGPKAVEAFRAGRPFNGEYAMRRADGSEFWAQLRGRPVDPEDASAGTIWSILDISGEVALRTRLKWSASHDVLTGLANRQALDDRMSQLFKAIDQAHPAALIAIDLDHFKPINDQAGHAAGDEMLKAVAAAITGRVRSKDLVVRTGGDEFVVLLEHCPAEVAQRAAGHIRDGIRGIELAWEDRILRVGASVGVAALKPAEHDAESWLKDADQACYAAKSSSRSDRRDAQRLLRLVTAGIASER